MQRASDVNGHFMARSVRRFPMGDETELLYFAGTRTAKLMPSCIGPILDQCRSLRTVEEHVENVMRKLAYPAEKVPAVRTVIQDCMRQGFFTNGRELIERFVRNGSQPRARIESVGIVTDGRVSVLKAALDSYARGFRLAGRSPRIVVVDDSRAASARDEARNLLRKFSAIYDMEACYAGREEKALFAEALIQAGHRRKAVEFAMFGAKGFSRTTGANRNCLLLQTAGEMIFSADDDTQHRIATPPQHTGQLAFSSAFSANRTWFFADRAAALASAAFSDCDLLGEHERYLGHTIADCLAGAPGLTNAEEPDLSAELLQAIESGAGHIAVTQTGLLGDSGSSTPSALLGSVGETRERMLRTFDDYQTACTSREILSAATGPTIVEGSFCMSYAFGLDNRLLLPPFFPVQRNSDGLFGLTLRRAYPDTYFAHIPFAILHTPPDERMYAPDAIWADARVHELPNLISIALSCCQCPQSGDAASRLRFVGEWMTMLGSLPPAEFEEFIAIRAWQVTSPYLARLSKLLKTAPGAPVWWCDDVKRYLKTFRTMLQDDRYTRPEDIEGKCSGEEIVQCAQSMVLSFGELLTEWPDIVATAAILRAQGTALAVRQCLF